MRCVMPFCTNKRRYDDDYHKPIMHPKIVIKCSLDRFEMGRNCYFKWNSVENQGPPRKKLRSSRESGNTVRSSEDSQRDSDFTLAKTYLAELVIYDKRHRCLLSEGDYELVLEEQVTKSASNRQWESVSDEKVSQLVQKGCSVVITWEFWVVSMYSGNALLCRREVACNVHCVVLMLPIKICYKLNSVFGFSDICVNVK